ncbi:MAG: TetR/AcrR family transcriptional regulator [Novosphingobium sp.]
MGRASKEAAARTRIRIIETASDLFRSSGVDQVSVADVMSALGLTTGGFYKHFSSKEALVAEAMGLAFERSSTAWRDANRHDDEAPRRRRARLVDYYLRPDPQTRCPMIAFAAHVASAPARCGARQSYRQGTEALLDSFAGPTGRGAPPSTAEREAMLLFAAMIGARVLKEAAGDAEWMDRIRDAVRHAAGAAA